MLLCRAVSDIFEEELFTTAFAAVSMIGTLSNAVTWGIGPLFSIEVKSCIVAVMAATAMSAMTNVARMGRERR